MNQTPSQPAPQYHHAMGQLLVLYTQVDRRYLKKVHLEFHPRASG